MGRVRLRVWTAPQTRGDPTRGHRTRSSSHSVRMGRRLPPNFGQATRRSSSPTTASLAPSRRRSVALRRCRSRSCTNAGRWPRLRTRPSLRAGASLTWRRGMVFWRGRGCFLGGGAWTICGLRGCGQAQGRLRPRLRRNGRLPLAPRHRRVRRGLHRCGERPIGGGAPRRSARMRGPLRPHT